MPTVAFCLKQMKFFFFFVEYFFLLYKKCLRMSSATILQGTLTLVMPI